MELIHSEINEAQSMKRRRRLQKFVNKNYFCNRIEHKPRQNNSISKHILIASANTLLLIRRFLPMNP